MIFEFALTAIRTSSTYVVTAKATSFCRAALLVVEPHSISTVPLVTKGKRFCEVYEKVGLMDHLDPRPYPPDWHMHQLGQRYLEHVLSVCYEVDEPQPGDIVLYHFGKCISHGAIVVEWPTIIHSYIHQGVILQDGTKGSLARRIAGFFRMKRLKE